jgi:hypothetical protein
MMRLGRERAAGLRAGLRGGACALGIAAALGLGLGLAVVPALRVVAQESAAWTPPTLAWDAASRTAADSMVVGNGRVGANVWTDEQTGELVIMPARTDSIDENARLLKLGRVRIAWGAVAPGAAAADRAILAEGRLEFRRGDASIEVFVDPDRDVIHVRGRSPAAGGVRASVECWRNERREIKGSGSNSERNASWTMHDGGAGGSAGDVRIYETPDRFTPAESGVDAVEWWHRNEESCVPFTLRHQSIEGLAGAFDPITGNTFGGRLEADGFVIDGERAIRSRGDVGSFDLRIATHAGVTASAEAWLGQVRRVAAGSRDADRASARLRAWWREFWGRSFVDASGGGEDSTAGAIARAYAVQRYVTACQGRGAYPIKFNGGLFTVDPVFAGVPGLNSDWRRWGDGYWWQNTRMMYHPMFATGDAEMAEPLFAMYERVRELSESRAAKYYGARGAYFPETMSIFGSYSNGDYGWNRAGLEPGVVLCPWWDDAWNQGPELVGLMLDRWDYTRDRAFVRERLAPMAVSVLTYFDTRFGKDAAGKIVLDPTQVVETYWDGVVNDAPTVAGIRSVTERLCALPPGLLTGDQRAFFERMRRACPEVPIELERERISGLTRTRLAPAEKYNPRRISNVENGELYPVWPFALVRLGREDLLPEALSAWRNRRNDLSVGWGYDGNVAALLGLTDECVRIMKAKVANSHKAYRWPATWGPNFDWLPDQNHGGNLLLTTNLMLLQAEPLELGGTIRVLPAWPKDWDVKFRLWAPGKTVVECEVRGGTVESLRVTPRERMKDVVMGEGWGGEGGKR